MGNHYDLSELPTVVSKNGKYVVYDGNKRIALIKYIQNPEWSNDIERKLFPSFTSVPEELKNLKEVPCNVCDEETALENIERKHTKTGSWKQLQRDYFYHYLRKQPKSIFLKFEESTKLISNNPSLNQGFVKTEVLTEENLRNIGFQFIDDALHTNYDSKTNSEILNKTTSLIKNKNISTRGENRSKLKEPLVKEYPELKNIIKPFEFNKSKKFNPQQVNSLNDSAKGVDVPNTKKQTRRSAENKIDLFGGKLILAHGDTNDLYRDIVKVYEYYEKNKEKDSLGDGYKAIIRISLRLLVETASGGTKTRDANTYVSDYFLKAKNNLSQNMKTTMKSESLQEATQFKTLLNIGAHNYTASKNLEHTLAMSVIIGEMLKISHSKK